MEAHQATRLIITPEIHEILEKRRILTEDIQRVIHETEKGGNRLIHPKTGHLKACFRPFRATLWVEADGRSRQGS